MILNKWILLAPAFTLLGIHGKFNSFSQNVLVHSLSAEEPITFISQRKTGGPTMAYKCDGLAIEANHHP